MLNIDGKLGFRVKNKDNNKHASKNKNNLAIWSFCLSLWYHISAW